jgi:hypothetical protein
LGYDSTGHEAVKLNPTAWAGRAVEFRRQTAAEAPGQPSHAERVSISDPALEASRGRGRPALGDVRWYRAVRKVANRRHVAPMSDDPAWRASAAPSARPAAVRGAGRNASVAIAAYLANMPLSGSPLS